MKLQQPTRLTLSQQVVSQLEELIESGQWAVGSRIPAEPELVKQLGVSRNTIREAVRALIHTGLLEAKPGDGTYVCSSSDLKAAIQRRLRKSSIHDTFEVRYCLEREAARLAANRRTEEDVAKMRDCLERRDAAIATGDTDTYIRTDLELHRLVMAATYNPLLIDLYDHMSDSLHQSIHTVVEDTLTENEHHLAHHDMVEAIAASDPEGAENATRSYIEAMRSALLSREERNPNYEKHVSGKKPINK
ncbi:FadR/GntR family transcriptional regulator [Paenibacillus sp. J2TS4]|uniref:FadR/GntR family transcriptional regulator n=1 Tax=Paenibacillus sp. J2TS4 TaxID=2807194 RepID=UPI001B1CC4DC|nr:FadR/GntR family transcriptional regulator [Paenibacillus sp. J2TS4]GIP31479.1 GntR family transcriptional regulator [Paenibacillus sp. J2TS4]